MECRFRFVNNEQAISTALALTLGMGAVSIFAGVDRLPTTSLAVLVESLRAVALALHTGQDRILVNGDEVRCQTAKSQGLRFS